jgi:hypothetical protein
MAINTSRLAYQDCFDLMERAISDEFPTGLRIKFASWNEANHFRQRIHNARYVDRNDNAELYDKSNVMHGRSVYDVLNCRIKELSDGWWLRLERVDARKFEVEPLESPETLPQPVVITAVISVNGGQQVEAPVMRLAKFKRRF